MKGVGDCEWVHPTCGVKFFNFGVKGKDFARFLEKKGHKVIPNGERFFVSIIGENNKKAKRVFNELFHDAFEVGEHVHCWEHGPGCRDRFTRVMREEVKAFIKS